MKPVVWYVAAHYDNPGGIEVYLLHYATEMRRLGFDTRIVVCEPLPETPHRCLLALAERGIPIESLAAGCAGRLRRDLARWVAPLWLRALCAGRRPPSLAACRRWVFKRNVCRVLADRLRRERPDLIHVKGRLMSEAWAVLPLERTVFHVATRGQRDASWSDAEVAAFQPFARGVARVFAPGTEVAANFRQAFAVDRPVEVVFTMAPDEAEGQRSAGEVSGAGSKIVASGPQPSALGPPPSVASLRFGTVCRLVEGKGVPETLFALAAYRDRHGVELPFTFAGRGPLESAIRSFAEMQGLRHVRCMPVVTPAAALAEMDVFVLPSWSEAMPLSVVEALMCGKPCLVSAVGGVRDLVRHGVEGLLVEAGDDPALLVALERFAVMTANELSAYGARARLRYETACRPETVCAQVVAHYRAILSR